MGYNFFSVQYGGQCFCNNAYATSIQYIKVADSECEGMNNGRELYWGNSWRNAIYRHINAPNAINIPVTAAPTSAPVHVQDSQFIGCYNDDDNRDLKNYVGDISSNVGECLTKCASAKYKYFSVQNGGQCFCDNAYATAPQYTKVADSDCAAMNNGRSLYWGNSWRNAIYKVTPYPENFNLRHKATQKIVSQCGGDVCLSSGTPLVLSLSQPSEISNYASAGYKAFSVVGQSGQYLRHAGYVMHVHSIASTTIPYDFAYLPELIGANTYVLHNPYGNYGYDLGYDASSDKVLIVAKGSANTEWEFVSAVAPTTPAPTFPPTSTTQYIGCYIDDDNRDVKNYVGDISSNVGECQARCSTYKYFAVQNGGQCFCNNAYATAPQYTKVADSDCAAMNNGRSLYWGNSWRNAIYKVTPYPENFNLRHKATQKIVSQCGGDVCLSSGTPLVLSLSQPSEISNYASAGYKAFSVVGQSGQYLRHAGYVMHVHSIASTTIPYDFAYLPELIGANTYVLHNPYGNYGYDLGYDASSDKVLIVAKGSANTEWEFVPTGLSTPAPTTIVPTFPPVSVEQYIGCYIDDGNRDMAPTWTYAKSTSECQALCAGSSFFAMQAGYACFCSNVYSTKPQYAKVADSECGGVTSNSLGAGWRNAVFIFVFVYVYFRFIVILILSLPMYLKLLLLLLQLLHFLQLLLNNILVVILMMVIEIWLQLGLMLSQLVNAKLCALDHLFLQCKLAMLVFVLMFILLNHNMLKSLILNVVVLGPTLWEVAGEMLYLILFCIIMFILGLSSCKF